MIVCTFCDLCSRLRNGVKTRKKKVIVIFTNMNYRILEVLSLYGFIEKFVLINGYYLEVTLKYINKRPVFSTIEVLSKPSNRRFVKWKFLYSKKFFKNEFLLISTSKGILTREEARLFRVGGQLLCSIF